MSQAEILGELPKLDARARREIFDRLCEIEEQDLLVRPDTEEKNLLDRELVDFRKNPEAGSSWPEVESRLRRSRS
ncbi:MAG TPA: hypothetical protein VGO57_12035 [Verrucomicrobiae bacterium]|jgi:hypothetical protein